MEILKRFPRKNATMWTDVDAEGRKVYGVTQNLWGGTPYEPSNLTAPSQKAAWEEYYHLADMSQRYANSRF